MLISSVVLLIFCVVLFCFQAFTLRQQSAHELALVGEMTAHNCTTTVVFKDEDAAAQILSGLKTMPQIVSARLDLNDGPSLASFGPAHDQTEMQAARFSAGFLAHKAVAYSSRSRSCLTANAKARFCCSPT